MDNFIKIVPACGQRNRLPRQSLGKCAIGCFAVSWGHISVVLNKAEAAEQRDASAVVDAPAVEQQVDAAPDAVRPCRS